jgi:3-polyprenyl-4-hydroxybenzoate decarboxylase
MDTLDYTGPKVNEGSKAMLAGLGQPVRDLPAEFSGPLPPGLREAAVFAPGVLVVSGPSYENDPAFASRAVCAAEFSGWPLIVLCDRAEDAARSDRSFLWHVFTRFEPAADIHAAKKEVVRNHLAFSPPILLDARMKPWMPETVESDPDTARLVEKRWGEYAPGLKIFG